MHDRKTEQQQEVLASLEVHPFGHEQKLEAYRFEKMPCFSTSGGVIGTIFHGIRLSEHYTKLSFQLNQLISGARSPVASHIESTHSVSSLSNRQHEILFLTGLGFSAKEIASRLNLSKRTVENYTAQIRTRFNVHKAHELKDMAWAEGWVNTIPKRFLNPQSILIN